MYWYQRIIKVSAHALISIYQVCAELGLRVDRRSRLQLCSELTAQVTDVTTIDAGGLLEGLPVHRLARRPTAGPPRDSDILSERRTQSCGVQAGAPRSHPPLSIESCMFTSRS